MNRAAPPPPPPLPRRPWWTVLAFLVVLTAVGGSRTALGAGALLTLGLATVRLRSRLGSLLGSPRRGSGRAGMGWGWGAGATGARGRAGADPAAIVLGAEASGRPLALGVRELGAHGLILGASGAGKSTTLLAILSERIVRGAPVVAIDLKGSPAFAGALQQAASAAGRRLRVWTPDGPERWNPLSAGNPTELKDKLIATERFTEPHYRRAAERYVQLALQVLVERAPGEPVTLTAVVAMLDPRRLQAAAAGLPAARREHVEDYVAGLTRDQQSAVRGLAARLAIITESHTGRFLEGPDPIELRRALAGEYLVLFSLNSSVYGALSAQLGTLAVQDLVGAAGHRLTAGSDEQALVAIDEFSALGSDNVMALLARGREAGVSVLLATQELADLDRAARGLRDQVLGNTAVKIAHRQDVPESAVTVARMAGMVQEWERTYAVRPGPLGLTDARRGTLRQVERYRIDPTAIQSLGTGEAVVIRKTPVATARTIRVRPPAPRDGPER